jgi:iron complex outermembrane receptor protein
MNKCNRLWALVLMGLSCGYAPEGYAQTLDDVVVSASRSEQSIFDAPGSIDAVSRTRIESSGPQINISESLGYVPGINVANRNNYAQDLQISIRGFGSRAPFGVRGVRLMIDGLPQSLPDGQGQTSQFSATSTERIEVLRGPLAALYGNASGGVIQAFTREPSAHPELDITGYAGSDSLHRSSLQYSETRGDYGLVFDYGALSSEGFRQYSAAERHHINSKLVKKHGSGKTNFIINILDQKKSEDPGSRTLSEFKASPYAANNTAVSNSNLLYKAGKKFVQSMAGLVDERAIGDSRITTRAYVAMRDLDNPGRSNVWFLIDRVQYGLGLDYQAPFRLLNTDATLSFGLEGDRVTDDRRGRTNSSGVMGSSDNRKEDNIAVNYGAYARADWFLDEKLSLTTGIRLTQVKLQVKDYYLDDLIDGSGSKTYSGASPVIGVVRHLSPEQNLFANIGQSFETPTLNEVLYTPTGTSTCNSNCSRNSFYGLNAAKSTQVEVGWKWQPEKQKAIRVSAFFTKTSDDIAPEFITATGATWQNADTKRVGLEISAQGLLTQNFSAATSFSLLQASYTEAFTIRGSSTTFASTVRSGDRLTNVPNDRLQAELRYRSSDMTTRQIPRLQSALELISVGRIYVRSNNSESTSRYNLINLSLTSTAALGGGTIAAYARVDNVTDKLYVASTIGDQESGRYYEPGSPRNWLVGFKYTLTL